MSAIPAFPDYAFPSLSNRVNFRAMRVGVLLGAVCILNLLDLMYTLFANRIGMLHEMNPLADAFIRTGLTPSLVCFKILMMLCGLGLLWKVRENKLVIPACWLLFAAYIGLSIIWYSWVCSVNHDMELRIANALPPLVQTDGY